MKFFHYLTEIIGWLQIIAGPVLVGLLIGALVYYNHQNTRGLIGGITIAIAGLIAGIVLGIYIWRKYGTVNFLSRLSATRELDKKDRE